MGKKKVAGETAEKALKEREVVEEAAAKGASRSSASRFENGRVYIKASYNNTLISITDDKGNLVSWSSAGALGFSGPKKATAFAAAKVVSVIAEKIQKSGPWNVRVFVSGIGGGRDSAIRSLATRGFNIVSIHDVTPMPHNGPRPKKVRRV